MRDKAPHLLFQYTDKPKMYGKSRKHSSLFLFKSRDPPPTPPLPAPLPSSTAPAPPPRPSVGKTACVLLVIDSRGDNNRWTTASGLTCLPRLLLIHLLLLLLPPPRLRLRDTLSIKIASPAPPPLRALPPLRTRPPLRAPLPLRTPPPGAVSLPMRYLILSPCLPACLPGLVFALSTSML